MSRLSRPHQVVVPLALALVAATGVGAPAASASAGLDKSTAQRIARSAAVKEVAKGGIHSRASQWSASCRRGRSGDWTCRVRSRPAKSWGTLRVSSRTFRAYRIRIGSRF
ncbi:hypothetical protein [Patulibacter defluvii]|uniref:hypothetical protein n=1 Tax=Patulibacter defluvii TaxID=3095358 RepID=UPI002A75870D|nr:hypothetical protein [Patulibacter sp. DM4]